MHPVRHPYEYHVRANRRVFAHLRGLPEDTCRRPLQRVFPTIGTRGTGGLRRGSPSWSATWSTTGPTTAGTSPPCGANWANAGAPADYVSYLFEAAARPSG